MLSLLQFSPFRLIRTSLNVFDQTFSEKKPWLFTTYNIVFPLFACIHNHLVFPLYGAIALILTKNINLAMKFQISRP